MYIEVARYIRICYICRGWRASVNTAYAFLERRRGRFSPFLLLFLHRPDSTQSDKQIYFKPSSAREQNHEAERRMENSIIQYSAGSGGARRNKNRISHKIYKEVLLRRENYSVILIYLKIQLYIDCGVLIISLFSFDLFYYNVEGATWNVYWSLKSV